MYEEKFPKTMKKGKEWKGERVFLKNWYIVHQIWDESKDRMFVAASEARSISGGTYTDSANGITWKEPKRHMMSPNLMMIVAKAHYEPSEKFVKYINNLAKTTKNKKLKEDAESFAKKYVDNADDRAKIEKEIEKIDKQIAKLQDQKEKLRKSLR